MTTTTVRTLVDTERVPPLSLPPAGPLVGRSDDLDALTGAVGLTQGRPAATAVLLSGDAGVGKTRLLGELTALAPVSYTHLRAHET